jgi:hypothetical protein
MGGVAPGGRSQQKQLCGRVFLRARPCASEEPLTSGSESCIVMPAELYDCTVDERTFALLRQQGELAESKAQ